MSQKQLNPEHLKRIRDLVTFAPYPALQSMVLQDLGMGFATVQIIVEPKHFQPYGVVHGGVLATLVDTAAYWAVYCSVEDESAVLTSVDLKLNYLGPVTEGILTAKGQLVKMGKKIGYAMASVMDEKDQVVAHGASTLMVLLGKQKNFDPPLPPKFMT